jgi:hypothetical protein
MGELNDPQVQPTQSLDSDLTFICAVIRVFSRPRMRITGSSVEFVSSVDHRIFQNRILSSRSENTPTMQLTYHPKPVTFEETSYVSLSRRRTSLIGNHQFS